MVRLTLCRDVPHLACPATATPGGDGTVNEVVCSLLKHGAQRGVGLALLPLGTANDFASALGVSMVGAPVMLCLPTRTCRVHLRVAVRAHGSAGALSPNAHVQHSRPAGSADLVPPTHHQHAARARPPHLSSIPAAPLSKQDPAVALRVALDPSAPRPVDVGLVNGHPFVNVALVGRPGF